MAKIVKGRMNMNIASVFQGQIKVRVVIESMHMIPSRSTTYIQQAARLQLKRIKFLRLTGVILIIS